MKNKCMECGVALAKITRVNKGIEYSAFKCKSCGEEIMNMAQTENYMKKAEKTRQRLN